MKRFFTSMLALACAMFVGVSCTPDNGEGSNDPKDLTFKVTFSDATPGYAAYTCTPSNNAAYIIANSLQLQEFSIKGATPEELMSNYLQTLADYEMLTNEYKGNYWYKGKSSGTVERYDAEQTATIYAVGFAVKETDMGTVAEFTTEVTAVEVPFNEYPVVTVPGANEENQVAVSVAYEAGSCTVEYVIENVDPNAKVYTENAPAWVTSVEWADNVLTITVAENEKAVARTATLPVMYGDPNSYVSYSYHDVVLTQAKNPNATPVTFDVKIKESKFYGFDVDVTPSDPEVKYVVNVCTYEANKDLTSLANGAVGNWNPQYYTGTQTALPVSANPASYDWNGYDYYVYVYAIETTTEKRTQWQFVDGEYVQVEVEMEKVVAVASEVYSDYGTVAYEQMPKLTLVGDNLNYDANEEDYKYVVYGAGHTYTFSYEVENPVEGAALALNGGGDEADDNYFADLLGNDNKVVFDNEAKTVTLTLNDFPADWNYSWEPKVEMSFSYRGPNGETWGVSASLTIYWYPASAAPGVPDMGGDL